MRCRVELTDDPRPLSDRDSTFIQDYVRMVDVDNDNGRESWFYTYNHDFDHPYFAPRSGFVRLKMKYQGMVGTVGSDGKTRLAWLVNVDFGGLIPSSFTTGLLTTVAAFPITVVESTEQELAAQKAEVSATANFPSLDDIGHEAAEVSRGETVGEVQEELKSAGKRDDSLREAEAELKKVQIRAEVLCDELQEVTAERDAALKRAEKAEGRAEKAEAELSVLRRRLKRATGGGEEEGGEG